MARTTNKLVARNLDKKAPGRHGDGGGLYFHVREGGTAAWVFRYRDRATGKTRDKGLGPYPDVSLAEARAGATNMRATLRGGVDPIESKRAAVQAIKLERAKAKTFKDCRDAFIQAHKAGWRNAKHAQQWKNTLDTHAEALLELAVQAIDTTIVLNVLEPIWTTKTETATRVRQRIEAVLDWATTRGYRKGENPARWRGHLENLLPEASKVRKVEPRAALPYALMGAFWKKLAAINTLASQALRLQILTATRPSEATGAQWSEFDLAARTWTIPGSRMKAGKDHRVPLSKELVTMLETLDDARDGWLFPGTGRNPAPLTIAATLKLVKELRPGITAHGFRSTFRDWAADQTAYPRDVAEMALAHTIKDKSEAAYRRSDMLERRAALMQDWSNYCHQTANRTQGARHKSKAKSLDGA